jgi:Leucine-rich repeat (LRR) protein
MIECTIAQSPQTKRDDDTMDSLSNTTGERSDYWWYRLRRQFPCVVWLYISLLLVFIGVLVGFLGPWNKDENSRHSPPHDVAKVYTQREVLTALYNSANGSYWDRNDNWTNPIGSECSWYGIGCNRAHEIVHINLGWNSLQGSLPTILGELPRLRSLSFRSNHNLQGPISSELGNLANLTNLRLDETDLSGTIPTQLFSLTMLRYMPLIDMEALSCSIPTWIGQWHRLESLDNYSNPLLTGSLPTEVGWLTMLTRLQVFFNDQLGGPLPSELGNLSRLRELRLFHNDFTGKLPSEHGRLLSLQELVFDFDRLTGSIPFEWQGMPHLRHLSMSNNSLTGTIPEWLGTSRRKLNDLHVGSNPLQHLHLDRNQLTGSVPSQLRDLSQLQYLLLALNRLTCSIPDSICALREGGTLKRLEVGCHEVDCTCRTNCDPRQSISKRTR